MEYIRNIIMDISKRLYQTIDAKQNDIGRYIQFTLTNNGVALDLTGHTVKIFGLKSNGNIIFNNVAVVDATKGIVKAELTSQTLAAVELLNCDLVLYGSNLTKISTISFNINVIKSINNDNAIESSNEFTGLTQALSTVQQYDNRISGVETNKADKTTTDSISNKIGLLNNLSTNEKDDLVGAINEHETQLNDIVQHTDALETNKADKTEVNTLATEKATKTEVEVERQRINSFTSLAQGSTTGDAELIDGRVGADGITYPNIGNAIRGQFNNSKSNLSDLNCYNLMFDYAHPSITVNGITFTYNSDGSYSVSGTATADALCNFYLNTSVLPSNLKQGKTYRVYYTSTNVQLVIWLYKDTVYNTGTSTINNFYQFTIPNGVNGAIIRLRVLSGKTVNETVKPVMLGTYTNAELKDLVDASEISSTEKINNFNKTGTISATGNPIVLTNTSKSSLNDFSASGISSDTLVSISGKNILYIATDMVKRINNGVTYDFANGVVTISSTGAIANSVSSGDNFNVKYRYLNGVEWWHNFKFKFANDTTVSVSGNCSVHQTYDYKAQMQVSDGTLNLYVDGNGLTFVAKAGIEYGVRFVVLSGFVGNVTFKPQIEIGSSITSYEPFIGARNVYSDGITVLKNKGSQVGTTVIYTYDNAIITANANTMSVLEKTETNKKAIDNFNLLTSYKIPFSKPRKPTIGFIDDDTSSVELVRRYHDVFANKGVVGGYAVMTKNLDDQEGLADLLLEYEKEGFSCLYHCYYQRGDETRYWESGNPMYDKTLIRENFMRGLRSMAQYGFSNYKYWITPYGVNDDFIKSLARTHGMECLFTMSGALSNGSFVNIGGNCDRYDIPRISVSASSSQERTKKIIDGCIKSNGWLVIVTHANGWGETTEVDNKLSEIIQYALDNGAEIKSVPEAFEIMKPAFYLSELF